MRQDHRGYNSPAPPRSDGGSLDHLKGSVDRCCGVDPLLSPFEMCCCCIILKLRCDGIPPQQRASRATDLKVRGLLAGRNVCPETGSVLLCWNPIPKRKRSVFKEDAGAKSKIKPAVVTATEKRQYRCKQCEEAFFTLQALGGHITARPRIRKVPPLNHLMDTEQESEKAERRQRWWLLRRWVVTSKQKISSGAAIHAIENALAGYRSNSRAHEYATHRRPLSIDLNADPIDNEQSSA